MLYHWVPRAEVFSNTSITKWNQCPRNYNFAAVATERGTLASWDGGQPWQALPSRKAGSRAQAQWGLPAWTREHSEPSRAKKGISHWNEMSQVLHLCKCQQVSTQSCAGQPGAAQGVWKPDTRPHQAAETGRQRNWLARQWKIPLSIWAVWSPRCSPHSLVLSHFVWGFSPAFSLCNILFPCYVGTEGKETAGRKEFKIFVLFNIDKDSRLHRLIHRLQGFGFFLFIIICSCADFKNISVQSTLHLCNSNSCKNSYSLSFSGN